jgi:hypothetical protein
MMLPKCLDKYSEARPKDSSDLKAIELIEKFRKLYGDDYINSIIFTQEDAVKALNDLHIKENTTFFKYYLQTYDEPDIYHGDLIYGLSEVLENAKNPFHSKYPEIGKRYLQLSSIEGEYSYFYDKETDYLYGIDWSEMDDFFVKRKLKEPLFKSFYDFLGWYYQPALVKE